MEIKLNVKLCKDCKWSNPMMETGGIWALVCTNPYVNVKDPDALTQFKFKGSRCRNERELKWFAACGQKGKLFEQKENV